MSSKSDENRVYGHSLKDATSYPDKMLHLTAIRCYIFRRKLVQVCSLSYLPPKGTHGDECHQQQSDDKDADANRSLHHKVRRVLVDEVIGKGNSYHERCSENQEVFPEKQLVQVLYAGTVCFSDGYLTITATDIEKRDAEKAETTNQNAYQSKDVVNHG